MSEKERAVIERIGEKIAGLPEELRGPVLQRVNDIASGAMMVIEAQTGTPSASCATGEHPLSQLR